jgi:hypothetical protein
MRPPGRRFPKVNGDGTFTVRVYFASPPVEPIATVRSWLATWLSEHPDALGDSKPISCYFTAPPELEAGPAGELTMLLRGVGDEGPLRFWKDWYVRICSELMARYPGVGKVVRVESVPVA